MYYLFVDSTVCCQWCRTPYQHVVEDDPNKVIVKLCPVCDRWPPGLLDLTQKLGEDDGSL